ncbi:MAG: hypothetical protein JW715_15235 [Sedimentisphaerales bacterium]|nr:hypothetical protein [Sedimentisphaerales bacterium]
MKTFAVEIENKVDELLVCLDKDIEHIQKSLSYLDELRTLVIRRDDAALSTLLEEIRTESNGYKKNESNRQSIRLELAECLGCAAKDITLSALERFAPEAKKEILVRNKMKLKALIEELKKEYSCTAMLLADCARFNDKLLKSIFNLGRTGEVYYNANGAAKQQRDAAFVNMKF